MDQTKGGSSLLHCASRCNCSPSNSDIVANCPKASRAVSSKQLGTQNSSVCVGWIRIWARASLVGMIFVNLALSNSKNARMPSVRQTYRVKSANQDKQQACACQQRAWAEPPKKKATTLGHFRGPTLKSPARSERQMLCAASSFKRSAQSSGKALT